MSGTSPEVESDRVIVITELTTETIKSETRPIAFAMALALSLSLVVPTRFT